MLWFIQVSVVSLIIIFVIHNLYSFFKETLTVPKIKDMVKRPQQRYDTLFRELRNQVANTNPNANNSNNSNNSNNNSNNNANTVNSNSNADDMKNELKRYLMDLNSSHTTRTIQDPQPQSDFIEMGSIYK
jgi:cell shape-determining protein MreC